MQLDWFRAGIPKLIQNKFDSAAFLEGPDAGNDAGVLVYKGWRVLPPINARQSAYRRCSQ